MENEYIFTFGSNHVTQDGMSLGNYYCVIRSSDEKEARDEMFKCRGDKWAFCYKSKEKAGVQRFNLREVTTEMIYLINKD